MKRLVIIVLTLILLAAAAYIADQYWIHRYDSVIATEAARYRVDPDLVWSIAYEESYFAPWKNGKAGEIGIMQVTPGVLQDWASENADAAIQQRSASDASTMLRDPQRNIHIACWYYRRRRTTFVTSPIERRACWPLTTPGAVGPQTGIAFPKARHPSPSSNS